MKPQVSVIVCTFNRYDLLSEAVASIKLQSLAQDAYELIIVDNSDEPATREQLPAGLETVCNYRYITEARPGLSRARNIGIKAAAGGIVAFMDDDAKASPRWLARIIETFGESEGTGIVGGSGPSDLDRAAPVMAAPLARRILDDPRSRHSSPSSAGRRMACRHQYRLSQECA